MATQIIQKKVKDLETVATVNSNDYVLVETSEGTRKVSKADLLADVGGITQQPTGQVVGLTTTNINPYIFSKISKWNVLGDSITFGMGTTKTYHKYIEEEYPNLTVINYGISGTEICKGGTHPNPMCERYAQMGDADLITVFGGVNDFLHNAPIGSFEVRNNATFYGGLRTLMEGLLQKYPTKFIYFFTPLKVRGGTFGISNNQTNSKGHTLDQYINAIKECCNYYAIPCVDLNVTSGLNPNLDFIKTNQVPDGLHPNANGHLKLAKALTFISVGVGNGGGNEINPPTNNGVNLYDGELLRVNGSTGYYTSSGGWHNSTSAVSTSLIPVTKGSTIRVVADEEKYVDGLYLNYMKGETFVAQEKNGDAFQVSDLNSFTLNNSLDYDAIIFGAFVSNHEGFCIYQLS